MAELLTRPRGNWPPPLGGRISYSSPISGRERWPQIWRRWFSSRRLHTQLQSNPARVGGHGLMKPHNLQRAGTRSWGYQTGHPQHYLTNIMNKIVDKGQPCGLVWQTPMHLWGPWWGCRAGHSSTSRIKITLLFLNPSFDDPRHNTHRPPGARRTSQPA